MFRSRQSAAGDGLVGTFTAGAGKVGGGGDGFAGVREAWGHGDHVGIEGADDADERGHCS